MRNGSGSPPVHVHVSDATPVHVHVKSQRSQRTSPGRTPQGKTKVDQATLRPTAKVRTRVPWIPPGTAAYKWEGPTHCLEIRPPEPEPEPERSQSVLRLSDLTSEEEEVLQNRISQYERKIENLMTEVSSLRTEVELRRKEQLEEEEEVRLRGSMEKMQEEDAHHREGGSAPDPKVLLQKLWEAEADGTAAAQQVSALRDSVSKLCRTTASSGLAQQKDLLLQKLETFEATNRSLRQLLREQREFWAESVGPSEQKKVLLKRLADTEAENAHLAEKLQEKDRELQQLSQLLDSEKENARSSAEFSRSVERTRARLQNQLRSKEAENNRLSVQIKNLERAANQQRAQLGHVTQRLSGLKQEALEGREALRRASRAEEQRAQRSEDAAGQLSVQLLQTEEQAAEAVAAADVWRRRHAEEAEETRRLEAELSLLNSRMAELTEQLQGVQEAGRSDREALLGRLQGAAEENAAAKLENQNLKAAASAAEEKLSSTQTELQRVRASVGQYQALLDGYKVQVEKTRAEADRYRSLVDRAEHEARSVRAGLEGEMEEVRGELLGRLSELQVLPEVLRRCQQQLQEAEEQNRYQERRTEELRTNLTELRLKVQQVYPRSSAGRVLQNIQNRCVKPAGSQSPKRTSDGSGELSTQLTVLLMVLLFVSDGDPGTPIGPAHTEEQGSDGGEPAAAAQSRFFGQEAGGGVGSELGPSSSRLHAGPEHPQQSAPPGGEEPRMFSAEPPAGPGAGPRSPADLREQRTRRHQGALGPVQAGRTGDPAEQNRLRNGPSAPQRRGGGEAEPEPAAGPQGPAGAVGRNQPQPAELRPVPQSVLRRRAGRRGPQRRPAAPLPPLMSSEPARFSHLDRNWRRSVSSGDLWSSSAASEAQNLK
ncbi:outer dense fiber protein 2 isoform X2 [Fundulus heteroclitus]|uniref:outer dense fiber protein 2 isoform X2 n=1 Tax=Fundulus heteroclitus TaxID=8078 RepID=UPI00165A86A3|nr:outer dense fiber protein 2 isoform X2 [Fundulus heteroclitus]